MSEPRRILIPDVTERACFHCQAWRAWGTQAVSAEGSSTIQDQPLGQCRLRAPVIVADSLSDRSAVWPIIAADDWCLEFARDRK